MGAKFFPWKRPLLIILILHVPVDPEIRSRYKEYTQDLIERQDEPGAVKPSDELKKEVYKAFRPTISIFQSLNWTNQQISMYLNKTTGIKFNKRHIDKHIGLGRIDESSESKPTNIFETTADPSHQHDAVLFNQPSRSASNIAYPSTDSGYQTLDYGMYPDANNGLDYMPNQQNAVLFNQPSYGVRNIAHGYQTMDYGMHPEVSVQSSHLNPNLGMYRSKSVANNGLDYMTNQLHEQGPYFPTNAISPDAGLYRSVVIGSPAPAAPNDADHSHQNAELPSSAMDFSEFDQYLDLDYPGTVCRF